MDLKIKLLSLMLEDQEFQLIAAWIVALITGISIGYCNIKSKQWYQIGFILILVLLTRHAFNTFYMYRVFIDGSLASSPAIVLPLWSCPGAEDFWPDGWQRSRALMQDIRAIRQQAACYGSSAMGDLTYVVLSSLFVICFTALIIKTYTIFGARQRIIALLKYMMRIFGG